MQVFIYLLLRANVKDCGFQNIVVKRGEIAASYLTVKNATGQSLQNVRTAIKHLKSTGELTVTQYPKFSVFTIVNYDRFQCLPTDDLTGNQQATNRQLTGNQQAANTNIRKKESKNVRKEEYRESRPTLADVQAYVNEKGLRMDSASFVDHYEANGWRQANGNKIKDWKAACRNWARREKNYKPQKQEVYGSDASYGDVNDAFAKRAIGINDNYLLEGIL